MLHTRLVLERPLMEAICGGVGEVAQVCILYPLETIKVQCQAGGAPAAQVLAALARSGPATAARTLYAGFLSAALCSVLVGSVHYASFCISKRAALAAAAPAVAGAAGDGSSEGSSGGAANLLAATVGALATALVESPCELFRHQAQAGAVSSNFLGEMSTAVRRHGIGALYW